VSELKATHLENDAPRAQRSVFRISFNNATFLVAGYLLFGALVELARRQSNWRWAERVSWSMEAFPAGVLRMIRLLNPVREAYANGDLTELQVRFIYAGAVVVVVYLIGMSVGALMWLFLRVSRRL
jgi:hypothetical protein